ncbi:hypothetical protein HPP92_002655 [Vanilla planifolia]|uniref:DUF632 domain-containing protein n=1 Tax=Vanilla planifolia TaxID=51239 RepID=A0A835VMP7_VANPL|nr:hypothetical protein HPP92_002655 [Vanilla planifolia]
MGLPFLLEPQKVEEIKEFKFRQSQSIEASEGKNAVDIQVPNQHDLEGTCSADGTPGFTVYVNRRPGSMAEVMKDIENQFIRICDCAHEITVMLEASRSPYPSASNELSMRLLNPFKGDGYESSSEYSEDCCMVSGSRNLLWQVICFGKKLYEEVKSGERVRIAYEKKCLQLRSHDINGDEPSVVDKTRAAIRISIPLEDFNSYGGVDFQKD